MIEVFDVVQKILLVEVDKLKELTHRKDLNEFDIDDFNFGMEMKEIVKKKSVMNIY
jgi:hypothetical protein